MLARRDPEKRGLEERGERAAVMGAEKDGFRRAGCLEHCAEVLHPRLQRRKVAALIREPGAALIEQDQPE
jgi:hypothetical protein